MQPVPNGVNEALLTARRSSRSMATLEFEDYASSELLALPLRKHPLPLLRSPRATLGVMYHDVTANPCNLTGVIAVFNPVEGNPVEGAFTLIRIP
jgi:hypothetical protein